MRMSSDGREFLRELEGSSSEVYLDSGGAPTIGVGHLLTKSERLSGKIIIGNVIGDIREGLDPAQIDQLLEQDLLEPESVIVKYVRVPLTQNQFDALTSFVFNIGNTAFLESTLLKALNQGMYDAVPGQMARWVYDNGQVVPGLENRRAREIELWNRA